MRFYRTLLYQETGLWPLNLSSPNRKQTDIVLCTMNSQRQDSWTSIKKWLCYSGHRVALVVHRAQKSVPDLAGEWPTFLPPPLESCSGTANVDGPNSPAQRPVKWNFDDFFDLRLNKWLSKQSWCRWFETPLCSLWCHCNVSFMNIQDIHVKEWYEIGALTDSAHELPSIYVHDFSTSNSLKMPWIKTVIHMLFIGTEIKRHWWQDDSYDQLIYSPGCKCLSWYFLKVCHQCF